MHVTQAITAQTDSHNLTPNLQRLSEQLFGRGVVAADRGELETHVQPPRQHHLGAVRVLMTSLLRGVGGWNACGDGQPSVCVCVCVCVRACIAIGGQPIVCVWRNVAF